MWYQATTRLAVAIVIASAGCSVLLDPERHDDVARCSYDDDCPVPEDIRYESICTIAEGHEDASFSKICSPRAAVSCDPSDYPYRSAFADRAREAEVRPDRYVSRCDELGGVQGCPPGPDGCASGLAVHPLSGRCDDDDDATPPALAPESIVQAQDVLDQFCRSVYCDVRYVCHVGTDTCQPCELGLPLSRGGCGDLYPDGRRSSVYLRTDEIAASCHGPQGEPELAALGPFEDPPVTVDPSDDD